MTTAWHEIEAWRQVERRALLARRGAVPPAQGAEVRDIVARLVAEGVPGLTTACIGFYWPFRGELDLRPLMAELVARGARGALPAVATRGMALEFRPWTSGMALEPDAAGIPAPPTGQRARPAILLVPLLGYDDAGYRLGYGGGYFDRTLAALTPKPLTIGVGYAHGRLPTIRPQPHDVPMDAIATEEGMTWFERAGPALRRIEGGADGAEGEASYASPPCFLHELDPAYLGYLSREETLALLDELLAAERAGAGGADAARFRGMLNRHIVRLGGGPGCATGALPNRDRGWVVRQLREALPRIHDEALAADLAAMLHDRERAIARAESRPAAGEGA